MGSAEEFAVELYNAVQTGVPVELLSERVHGFDWDFARAIARSTDELRRSAGESQIGWKLGWTSEAMRLALGVNRPNWGTLWNSQVLRTELNLAKYIHPKVEPELLWRCPEKLTSPTMSASEVIEAGGEWALGLEVVDPRFPSFNFDALDNTADNSSCAAVCLGEFWELPEGVDLAAIEVSFDDGGESRSGEASQAMGSPAEAVAWLVRQLSEEGLALDRGEIVFTGGLTAPFDVMPQHTYALADSMGHQVSFVVS